MKKTVILLFIISVFGCSDANKSGNTLLALSGGQLAEIVVITDKQNLDSTFKLAVENILGEGKLLEGLPPPGEATFDILFTDETFFKGYFKTHHNIIVMLTLDNLTKMEKTFGANNRNQVETIINSQSDALGIKKKNIWASNQNVFYVTAKDREDLLSKIDEKKEELLNLAIESELKTGSRKLFTTKLKSDSFYHQSLRNSGYTVRKPKSYRIAKSKQNFKWLRKSSNTKEQQFDIVLFDIPKNEVGSMDVGSLIYARNQFLKSRIPGPSKGSYMSYSNKLPPVSKGILHKKKQGYEIRGWWDVANDWMGGPSVIRVFNDEKNDRVIFAEGFLYYPNENKAKELRQLELILNSLRING